MRIATEESPEVLFPELDDSPAHKKLLRAARAFHKAKSERSQLLKTAKEKQDSAESTLVGLMHENKIEKFRHDGMTVEVFNGKEKAVVKVEGDEEDEGDSDE